MPSSIDQLPNLGPKSQAMLLGAGITSTDQLLRNGNVGSTNRMYARWPAIQAAL
jgi:hypothetical protein